MLQPNQITVFNKFNLLLRIRYIWCVLVPLLDYKDVVLVFVGVGGDLLLLASLSVRIEVEVGVKVRSSSSLGLIVAFTKASICRFGDVKIREDMFPVETICLALVPTSYYYFFQNRTFKCIRFDNLKIKRKKERI